MSALFTDRVLRDIALPLSGESVFASPCLLLDLSAREALVLIILVRLSDVFKTREIVFEMRFGDVKLCCDVISDDECIREINEPSEEASWISRSNSERCEVSWNCSEKPALEALKETSLNIVLLKSWLEISWFPFKKGIMLQAFRSEIPESLISDMLASALMGRNVLPDLLTSGLCVAKSDEVEQPGRVSHGVQGWSGRVGKR